MATVFVTGGTGFLGKNLIAELVARGDRVIAAHRPTSDTSDLVRMQAELVVCGFEDVDGLARAAFGIPDGLVNEDRPSSAENTTYGYVRTKWLGEREVLAAVARGLPAVVLNPANILGPYDVTGWARLILLIDRGKLPAAPPGTGSFCHSVEVARAHIAAATRRQIGQQYLLGGVDATYVELGAVIARQLGRRAPRRAPAFALRMLGAVNDVIARFTGRGADITRQNATVFSRRLVCDSGKAMRELGYEPRSLQQMVADAIAWPRERGHLREHGAVPPRR